MKWGKSSKIPSFDNTALEYSLSFSVLDLSPSYGMKYTIFIDQRFISYMHLPVLDRRIFGFINYSPQSDLAAVVMHTGCLFPDDDPNSKETTHRHFQTISNIFEVMCCSETEYDNQANRYQIPKDVRIRGILVSILICPSPTTFQAVTKNGIRSRKTSRESFSYRIADFQILSYYDEMPKIVSIEDYGCKFVHQPIFQTSYTGEIGMKFTKSIFEQFVSIETITNHLFDVYRLFFDSKQNRYEIFIDKNNFFSVVRIIDPISIATIKKKPSSVKTEPIKDNLVFDDIQVGDTYFRFKDILIDDIDTFLLMNMLGKVSRNSSLKFNENQ